MTEDELLHRIALTMVPDLGPVCIRSLVAHCGSAMAVFKAKKKELSVIDGMGEARARQLRAWDDFEAAAREIHFLQQHKVKPLFITDQEYPQRLLHCYDPPSLLYYRGNADLNSRRIVSVIGTRSHTEYGRLITEQLVAALQPQQALIISGLAFGIDAIAHRAALQYGLPTIGVLAHGLDTVYPSQHRSLAKEIVDAGGLLTEFRRHTKPDKHNFPRRNRIVAGIADATIVIETAVKGGSMITAELAHSYNRDVFAVPGKITDHKSGGCLKLIRQQKALLFSGGEELIETMGWEETKKKQPPLQKELFVDLSADEQTLVRLLQEKGNLSIDELNLHSRLSNSSVAAAMLHLELQNIVGALPGKMYRLL